MACQVSTVAFREDPLKEVGPERKITGEISVAYCTSEFHSKTECCTIWKHLVVETHLHSRATSLKVSMS